MLQLASAIPMPRSRARRLPVHSRKAILDATRELLRDVSFAELDLQSVARLAGTTRRTIHNQFECKDDLYRASREELVFELARHVVDEIPERMEPVDGMRFLAAAAHDVLAHPVNQELNASIIRDGRRFAWLPKLYDHHIVTPLLQACEVFMMRIGQRRDTQSGKARATAEQFLIFVEALCSSGTYIRHRGDRSAGSCERQLDLAAKAFAATIAVS